MTIGGGKKIPRTSLPASLATTPRSLEQWKQYIEMRKLVCIVGQQAGAARRAPRRGTQPRVCLSSNRVPLSPSPTSLTPPPSRFPRSFFHSRLCLLPFVPVGYVRVPDSLPSSLLSLSLFHIPSVSRTDLLFFSLPFLSSHFFSSARRRDPRLVPHRPAERKDCKPADEPRIPEWGLLHSPFPPLVRVSRASSSLGWMDGWMEHARRAEREHRQLVGGGDTSSLPFRAHFNKLIGSLPPLRSGTGRIPAAFSR